MGSKTVQVCRDDKSAGGEYVICPLLSARPEKAHSEWQQIDRKGRDRAMLYGEPEIQVLLPGLKLKPGEGPRKVEITVKFAD